MNESESYQTKSIENTSLIKKIKPLFLEWILSSTSHGLPNVFRTNYLYLKVFWMICFLASTSCCLYLISASLIAYFSFSVTVSTSREIQTPIDFPAVSICNLNPFHSFINASLSSYSTNFGTNETSISIIERYLEVLKNQAAANPIYHFNGDLQSQLGFYLSEMLVSCYYSKKICSSSDFQMFRSYDYGNCYTFNKNSSNIKTISNAGSGHGLEIELFTGDPNDEVFIYKRGFYVVVHNQSVTPIMDNEGIYVNIGTETNIGVERTFYEKQSYPYSYCVIDPTSKTSSNSVLYKAILNELNEKAYRQKYCFKLCYQSLIMTNCSCFDPRYPNPFKSSNQKLKPCYLDQEYKCMQEIKLDFENTNLRLKCGDSLCPEECLKVNYLTSVSTATYPTDEYCKYLQNQVSLTSRFRNETNFNILTAQIKNSFVKINVFYNDITYTLLHESPTTTWDSLIGQIGGQLGLFIGISFLSMIELLELFFETLRIVFIHYKKNKITVQ